MAPYNLPQRLVTPLIPGIAGAVGTVFWLRDGDFNGRKVY